MDDIVNYSIHKWWWFILMLNLAASHHDPQLLKAYYELVLYAADMKEDQPQTIGTNWYN